MDDDLKRLFESMRLENSSAHEETRRHVDLVTEDTRRHVDVVTEDTRRHAEEMAEQTRRHFDVVAARLDGKIASVAELLSAVDAKVDRESADLRERMKEGFSETQAMIRFSHAELDHRVRSLEDTQRKLESAVEELRDRVDRLETPAH